MASKLSIIRLPTSAPLPIVAHVVPAEASEAAHIGATLAALGFCHKGTSGILGMQGAIASTIIGAISSSREVLKETVRLVTFPATDVAILEHLGRAVQDSSIDGGEIYTRLSAGIVLFASAYARGYSLDSDPAYDVILRRLNPATVWIGVGVLCFMAGRQPDAEAIAKTRKCGARNLKAVGQNEAAKPEDGYEVPFVDSAEFMADDAGAATIIGAWALMSAFRSTVFRILAPYAMMPMEPSQAYIGGPVFDMQWSEMAYVPMIRTFLDQFPKASRTASLKAQIAKFEAGEKSAKAIDEILLPFARIIMGSRFTYWTRRDMPSLVEISRIHHKSMNPSSAFYANPTLTDACEAVYARLIEDQKEDERKAFEDTDKKADASTAAAQAQTTATLVTSAVAPDPTARAAKPTSTVKKYVPPA